VSESEVVQQTNIPATPQSVYAVVTDYEAYPNFFPEFTESMILDTEADGTRIVEFVADFGKKTSYTLRIEHDDSKHTTSWTYVGGDLKDSKGGWTLSDDGKGGTDITYRIGVKVGFFVPKTISDALISRNVPTMFKQLAEEVKRRAEGQ